ncbi:MAG: T9SS type A sorting domain-containing protein [Bacteroidota bacterium]
MRAGYFILCFFPAIALSQPQFNNSYEISGESEILSNVIIEGNYYYTAGAYAYGSYSKPFVLQLDLNGDTIKTWKFGNDSLIYYTGFKTFFKEDSAFVFFGSVQDTSRKPYAGKIDLNGDTLWTSADWNMLNGAFMGGIRLNDGYVFAGGVETGTGSNLLDLIILKADTLGNIVWQKIIAGPDDEVAYSVDTTADNGLICAGYQDNPTMSWNIYVIKTDSVGNVSSGWPKVFSSTDSDAGWVKTCKNGEYIVWGGWESGSGNEKAHLRRLNQNGNTIWIKNFQNPGASAIIDVFTDFIEIENGDFVGIGSFYDSTISNPSGWMIRTDSLGNEKWRRKLQKRTNDNYLYGITQTPDGGFAMSGNTFADGSGNTTDAWVIKVDSMGCLTPGCAVGVEEFGISGLEFQVYPNPNDGKFVVEIESVEWAAAGLPDCNQAGGRRQEEMRVLIFDIFGRVVYEKIVNRNSQKFEIDISENASGIYFVNICSNAYSKTIKLVKE